MSDLETSPKGKSKPASDEKVKKLEDVEDDETPESERDMESKTAQEEDASDADKDESDEEDSDDDEELPPGLLEQPLEVEGKREKKKVERLTGPEFQKEQKEFTVEKGPGVPLGEMEDIKFNLDKTKSADCKYVYYILFGRAGKLSVAKKHIRQFSGDPNGKESKENSRRIAYMNKLSMDQLKNICKVLNLHWIGKKTELIERIEEFALNPQPSGKPPALASKKRKRSKTPAKKTKSKKAKTDKDKKKKKEKDEDNDSDDEANDYDDDEGESQSPKAKKRKMSPEKSSKSSPKKTPTKKKSEEKKKKNDKKKKEQQKKKTPKKELKKKASPKKKKSEEMSDLSSDSEDEPLSRLVDGGAPDDDEIRDVVENILDGADLEAVTMKAVVKKVYAKYPKFDLSDRKDFIKDTVRQIIS